MVELASVTRLSGDTKADAFDVLNAALAGLAGEMNVVHARITERLVTMLDGALWRQSGRRAPEAFVCWRFGVDNGIAKKLVRVTQRRAAFPVVVAKFDAGELSLAQVAAAVDAPAWADESMANLAECASPATIRKAVRLNDSPDYSHPDLAPFPRLPHQQWDSAEANEADPTVVADQADGGPIAEHQVEHADTDSGGTDTANDDDRARAFGGWLSFGPSGDGRW